MCWFELGLMPSHVTVQTEHGWENMSNNYNNRWEAHGVEVEFAEKNAQIDVCVKAPNVPIMRLKIRWDRKITGTLKFLADHWERAHGDLEWRGMVPQKVMPWYFMVYDGDITCGYGVKTGTASLCYWQVDSSGVTLCLDTRCGGAGVDLSDRILKAATLVFRKGKPEESPFVSTQKFCKMMCDNPILPKLPVYGGNNWYYAYGKSSSDQILDDAKLISTLSPSVHNRPYMVIDSCWQAYDTEYYNGGPWHEGNYLFANMAELASKMKTEGVKPGIWFRPLLTVMKVKDEYIFENNSTVTRSDSNGYGYILDPSHPEVLELIKKDVERFVGWGYQLIKFDFTCEDIFGRFGVDMGATIVEDGWSFADKKKTTAEIFSNLYKTIKRAAGDSIVIGCNTFSHLSAGILDLHRSGGDTSGRKWEKTRLYGINSLAFRLPQHNNFYAIDADCVGLTTKVPWDKNEQWLNLLAKSGTPLFVSASPDAMGTEQKKALAKAFEAAANGPYHAEPLDWLNTTCPSEWLMNNERLTFDWFGNTGVEFY